MEVEQWIHWLEDVMDDTSCIIIFTLNALYIIGNVNCEYLMHSFLLKLKFENVSYDDLDLLKGVNFI